jgi:hypothetical protein
VGDVGGVCGCWLVGVCGVCRGVAVGCCVNNSVAVLREGRVRTGGGFSSGWLGIKVRGWCWWGVIVWSGVRLVG